MNFPKPNYANVFLLVICLTNVVLADDQIDFIKDVMPIINARCVACHADGDAEGGLVMETHDALLKGGDSGAVITPGEANSSRLLLRVVGKSGARMPPKDEEPLTEGQIAILTRWVEQGAVGAEGDAPVLRHLNVPMIRASSDVLVPLTAIAVDNGGMMVAVGRTGVVQVKNEQGKVLQEWNKAKSGVENVNALEFSEDGSRLLVASGVAGAYGTALVFDVATGKLLYDLGGHRDVLYAARFSPDGQMVATAGYDRHIKLWDCQSGELLQTMKGHNGAVYDLAFSPDGELIVSGCADETVKIWRVDTGQRVATLSQPEGEVLAVDIVDDGKLIVAASSDNRLRVWDLIATERSKTYPIRITRFVDEYPLLKFEPTADGSRMVALTEKGDLKIIDTDSWETTVDVQELPDRGLDFALSADGGQILIALGNGQLIKRLLPAHQTSEASMQRKLQSRYLEIVDRAELNEAELRKTTGQDKGTVLVVPRSAEVTGSIADRGEVDAYRWEVNQGEVWAIDVDAIDGSEMDPFVAVFDADNQPVLRTRLQAVRDSYFTFRGKDSKQISDFRLFNWQNMHLNDYLYAGGEVTRLWMYPRGPDSGYNVYPNEGTRWTYFGTSHTTHALGEPAYVVRPLANGEKSVANGLPVFRIYYENDDDPSRLAGKNSRLLFTAPGDGAYTVRVSDTRGDGGEKFGYKLAIRPAQPRFKATVAKPNAEIRKGAGREVIVRVDRLDGFEGPVTFELQDLPDGLVSSFPVTIESGQRYAVGSIYAAENIQPWEGDVTPKVVARATIGGEAVEQAVGDLGVLKLGEQPSVMPSIQPIGGEVGFAENWTLQVQRGKSVTARVVVRRKEGFQGQVSFGKENAGRNTTHGVYVDNIGLNGLLVRQNENEREFVLTADPISPLGKRAFFLRGEVDGNVTTHPITVEVLP